MNTIAAWGEVQASVIRAMLGVQSAPPRPPDTFWMDVVGIPLDEWMGITSVFGLKVARMKRALGFYS